MFDQALHDRLLEEALTADPRVPGMTLMNTLAQRQALVLKATSKDYFECMQLNLWPLWVLIAALGLGPIAQAASLKIATLAPEGSSWMKEMRAAGDAVKTSTDGRVELKFFPGGVMGNSDTVLRKIKLGQLNGVTELTTANQDVAVYGLPFTFANLEEVRRVRLSLDPMIKAGFDKSGLIAAAITGGGSLHDEQQTDRHPGPGARDQGMGAGRRCGRADRLRGTGCPDRCNWHSAMSTPACRLVWSKP